MQSLRYICSQCGKDEKQCDCDRYCCLCQGSDNVRLCEDGAYYCANCREACDYMAQD
jgi:sulfur transfer complex TusBCD TusB component (DsrH family)